MSSEKELFKLVEVYFGDGLEMADNLVMKLEERIYRITVEDSQNRILRVDTVKPGRQF